MVKNKIAFSNPEDASLHINNTWDSVDKWWNSEEVKNTLSKILFLKHTRKLINLDKSTFKITNDSTINFFPV